MLAPGLLLFFLYSYFGRPVQLSAIKMLLRLRWFFISLLLIYGWMTPDPLTGEILFWSWPNELALTTGLRQVISLVLIILAVNLLLVTSRREDILQAIYWLALPLKWTGCSRDRLVLRVVLVLDQAVDMGEQAHQALTGKSSNAENVWSRIVGAATRIFQQTLERADALEEEEIIFQPLNAPVWYQWGLPLILMPAMFLLYN